LRRFRTAPARKPRTECCCQPVAFIIASIVAPAGDFSIATTLSCLELGSLFGRFALPSATGVADGATARLFADFDIEILRSVGDGHRAATTEVRAEVKWRWRAEEEFSQNRLGFAEPLVMLAALRSVFSS
jgi:hypothetical protein